MSHSEAFLHETEPKQDRLKHRLKKNIRRFLVLLLVAVALYGAFAAVVGLQVMSELADGRDHLFEARSQAIELSFTAARDEIHAATESFDLAKRRIVYLRPVSALPGIGQVLTDVTVLFLTSTQIIDSFSSLIDISYDILQLSGLSEEYIQDVQNGLEPTVTFDDLSSDTKRMILERLSASADDLEILFEQLSVAEEELELLARHEFLSPVYAVASDLLDDLEQVREYLSVVSIAAKIVPEIGGIDGERTYLLLFLNNNELRPGGGFIGSYGVLRTLYGDIAHLETEEVYILDDAAEPELTELAPAPLQRYNATTKWFFRDSNWSPDFAVSSLDSIERFLEEVSVIPEEELEDIPTTTRVDGVIGMTPDYVSSLLEITGDLTVSGQTFTAEGIADELEYQVQRGYISEGLPAEQRKEILADLVNELKRELFTLPISSWGAVIEASETALENKQLVFYNSDQELEDLYTTVGWGGRVLPSTPDVQMVVDANLASLKTDPVVDRDITYELGRSQTGEWVGRTTVRYTHMNDFDWKTTRYRTYTRLYVPTGSELLRVQGSMLDDAINNPSGAAGPVDVGEELGLTVFGAFISIEPLATGELVFEYLLSDEVVEAIQTDTYGLSFYKQIGAQSHTLTLELDFDKNVTHATPAEDDGEWGDDTYLLNTILDQDLMFSIAL